MSDGMRRELAYLSSHATNRYFIPNWGISYLALQSLTGCWNACLAGNRAFDIRHAQSPFPRERDIESW